MLGGGRIIITRRYIKLIIAFCFLIPILYETLAILSNNHEYRLQNSAVAKQGMEKIQGVNDYLKSVDYKGYLSGALKGGKNSSETGYVDDLEMEKEKGEDVKASSNTTSSETQAKFPFLKNDGSLNVDYFYQFKDHDEKKSKFRTTMDNNRLYADTMLQKISEPKVNNLKRPAKDPKQYQLANATFMSLVRNSEVDGIIKAIQQVEEKFNSKFHYPWTFINDADFSSEFKEKVKSHISGEAHFVKIPNELWRKPSNVDKAKEKEGIKYMLDNDVGYADMESYHNMCRFYSGNFFNLPHLQQFKYYWRVEPETKYFCSIDYDVFKFMQDNNKSYGFNINVYDGPDTIRTLWNTTVDFIKQHPQYLNRNGAYDWLLEDMQNPDKNEKSSYSTCHFWSNFEIADMDFFRSEAYTEWFKYLDQAGGFYYERWGDAPVHAIGLGLFEDKSKIHWFRDIGYEHFPFFNCPNSDKCDGRCDAGKFVPWSNLNAENCMGNWIKYGLSDDEKAMF